MSSSSGNLVKMDVDYSSMCDQKIPECTELALTAKKVREAIDTLLALEKQTRTASDLPSTSRVLVAIVSICRQANEWQLLNEQIVALTKRRSQFKQAVTKMIQECCTYVDEAPSPETKIKLIDTLRQVTEGKIYVEVERARLTHKLALIREADGNVIDAANIMQDLQIETYGSLEKNEKIELLLEQMRLCLAKKDYVRTQIISKKINAKMFDDDELQELKLRYYFLMMQLAEHEGSYLAACKHYRAVLYTPAIQADVVKRTEIARCVVLYVILAPYDNEQFDLMHRILCDNRMLDDIPVYRQLLVLFTTNELIQWTPFCSLYEKELRTVSTVFKSSEQGDKCWKELKDRIIEHNIRVMAKYYNRVTLKRMAELLDLSVDETEQFLSQLVVAKMIEAKTDRLSGIVVFASHKDPSDVLNEWSSSLSNLMLLVNKATHSINKEECTHQHLLTTA